MTNGVEVDTAKTSRAINYNAFGQDPGEDPDALILAAAAKVMAAHERCIRMYRRELPRDGSFARSARERRCALLELIAIPAASSAECVTKLNILTEMLPWFEGEDPDLFDCFVTFSREVTALLQRNEARKHSLAKPPRDGAGNSRVRWFLGLAAAVPGLINGRWDSGGLG